MTEKIKAYAKINLTLHVLGKREDGYHDLDLIFSPVSLCDEMEIGENDLDRIIFSCSIPEFSTEDNLVVRAYETMREKYPGRIPGLDVALKKTIPAGAGMGGGSADAAALLAFLAERYLPEISGQELIGIGAGLGADVPACLIRHATRGLGVGERLTHIRTEAAFPLLVIKPPYSFNTGEMYRRTDALLPDRHENRNDRMVKALEKEDAGAVSDLLYNIFEKAVPEREKIQTLKRILTENGARGSLMTGSGSAVFGIFEDTVKRDEAYEILSEKAASETEKDAPLYGCRIYSCEMVNRQ
ncbi:MAG: 4-(cytidine 5'-diphospho)-2-C-methyl-D-erythritol kinase [Lachnospiraceae bacterium]|nr:4-(cytidine 5'-diphospho)-2-C-methyl-D-erythritol kinase [Lachnospiraceae bacterium]